MAQAPDAMPYDMEWLERLAHYAFSYIPGPRWLENEAADKARQAHLDGGLTLALIDLIGRCPEIWQKMWEELAGEPT